MKKTKKTLPQKVCIITNDNFSYNLNVDNQNISFICSWNAEYFKDHYEKLGYKVILKSRY